MGLLLAHVNTELFTLPGPHGVVVCLSRACVCCNATRGAATRLAPPNAILTSEHRIPKLAIAPRDPTSSMAAPSTLFPAPEAVDADLLARANLFDTVERPKCSCLFIGTYLGLNAVYLDPETEPAVGGGCYARSGPKRINTKAEACAAWMLGIFSAEDGVCGSSKAVVVGLWLNRKKCAPRFRGENFRKAFSKERFELTLGQSECVRAWGRGVGEGRPACQWHHWALTH